MHEIHLLRQIPAHLLPKPHELELRKPVLDLAQRHLDHLHVDLAELLQVRMLLLHRDALPAVLSPPTCTYTRLATLIGFSSNSAKYDAMDTLMSDWNMRLEVRVRDRLTLIPQRPHRARPFRREGCVLGMVGSCSVRGGQGWLIRMPVLAKLGENAW